MLFFKNNYHLYHDALKKVPYENISQIPHLIPVVVSNRDLFHGYVLGPPDRWKNEEVS